jgi:hypothetical protein
MGDERTEVLKMVAEKKITVEEAERLLRALDEGDRRREQSPGKSEPRGFGLFGLGESFREMGEVIRNTVEEAVTGLGLDLDLGRDGLEEVPVQDGRFEVPAGTELTIRQRFNGSLELAPSATGACVVDGPIASVSRGPGKMVLRLSKSERGSISVQVPSTVSALKVGVTSGEIRATSLPCAAELKTMGGELNLIKLRQKFDAHTMGGRIFLDLYPELSADSSVSTMGGKVEVAVPGGLRARIRADTLGGRVKVDPGLGEVTSRNGFGEQGAVVDLGGPGASPRPEIRVSTLGGGVRVRKSEG